MSKSIKLKDNVYIDSTGVVHNRSGLNTVLNQLLTKINEQEQLINNQSQLINNQSQLINDLTPVVLYNNENSTIADSYTLSDSVANYSRITIYYKQTSYYTRTDKSVELYSPNDKTVLLEENIVLLTYNGSNYNGVYGLQRAFKVSGKTITLLNACNQKYVGLNSTGTWGVADSISITKVVGYKK